MKKENFLLIIIIIVLFSPISVTSFETYNCQDRPCGALGARSNQYVDGGCYFMKCSKDPANPAPGTPFCLYWEHMTPHLTCATRCNNGMDDDGDGDIDCNDSGCSSASNCKGRTPSSPGPQEPGSVEPCLGDLGCSNPGSKRCGGFATQA